MSEYTFDWDKLAFGSKKDLRKLEATFIPAPREISESRFTQLVKEYLPQGNIVVGIAKEDYIDGFEGQLQFRSLRATAIEKVIEKVNNSNSKNKIYVLEYRQRDGKHIYEKVRFRQIVLINGSWQATFHTRPEYYTLSATRQSFVFTSPFANEKEAKGAADKYASELDQLDWSSIQQTGNEHVMLAAADKIASRSFDHSFQTGATLAKKTKGGYLSILTVWNKIVPYETFAMHHGSLREKHYSPPGDLNYYDTVHAEVNVIIEAQKRKVDLKDTTLFINLLPCPTCARMLTETDIGEIVYRVDHSQGYAVAIFSEAGKSTRRIVDRQKVV